MILIGKEQDICGLCNHHWVMHKDVLAEYGLTNRHLAGGNEENPNWCYCSQQYPENNLEYLEYLYTKKRKGEISV
jgi:hypothetical protein